MRFPSFVVQEPSQANTMPTRFLEDETLPCAPYPRASSSHVLLDEVKLWDDSPVGIETNCLLPPSERFTCLSSSLSVLELTMSGFSQPQKLICLLFNLRSTSGFSKHSHSKQTLTCKSQSVLPE